MPLSNDLSTARKMEKSPSGITGLDQITGGGFPSGKPTLVVGGPGSGKSILGMQFAISGAEDYNEPAVFISFEESVEELVQNFSSLKFPAIQLIHDNKLYLENMVVDRGVTKISGEYSLEGLFIRLQLAVDTIGAKRMVIDGIETMFSAFDNDSVVRSEFHRLFQWTKERQLTTIVTSELGTVSLTRHGLEEYVADCVIVLDHRVLEEMSTRRVRVLKYRGSSHRANEFPFLINKSGLSVAPITSLDLEHRVSNERISSGIPDLDQMLEGKGYYRGSSVLITGTAGTGKTSIGAGFVYSACGLGKSALFFSFEESKEQIIRNMSSIGIDFKPFVEKGLLKIISLRPTSLDLENHLLSIIHTIIEIKPYAVVVDPISNLGSIGSLHQIKTVWTRVIAECKHIGTTTFFTNLCSGSDSIDTTESAVSSLMDTWLLLKEVEVQNESKITLKVRKSRGMAHSRKIKELILSKQGIKLSELQD